jgi:hypothetical protein
MDEDSTTDPDLDKLGKNKDHGGEDFESDLQVSASAFEALERDFQEVYGCLYFHKQLF